MGLELRIARALHRRIVYWNVCTLFRSRIATGRTWIKRVTLWLCRLILCMQRDARRILTGHSDLPALYGASITIAEIVAGRLCWKSQLFPHRPTAWAFHHRACSPLCFRSYITAVILSPFSESAPDLQPRPGSGSKKSFRAGNFHITFCDCFQAFLKSTKSIFLPHSMYLNK